MTTHVVPIQTNDGTFAATFNERGLSQLRFPAAAPAYRFIANDPNLPPSVKEWADLTASAIHGILSGRAPDKLPPMDISPGSEFQQEVWLAMLEIPMGQTRSYGELAKKIGRPKAVRALGGACGANPIPVLIPCHRVLAAQGSIGGFSGGLDWKRLLLGREGVLLKGM
ncbi:MAG TPA: methylated-DNA--[protein]-cysteine S-methyltransferase [Roseimicrobium sp.]|nr:methylated-DNA--[protein]-cysteine S-methyltransferase [Roseimicrobium sp.]